MSDSVYIQSLYISCYICDYCIYLFLQLTLSQDYVWNKNDTARTGDSLLKTVEQVCI